MKKPKKLEKGNTIGLIGPANYVPYELIDKGGNILTKMGYKVIKGNSCGKKWYSFSGNDQLRADDLNEMFLSKNIDAVLCICGGYGSNRIIDLINFDNIRKNPKLFIGFSDITTLHCAIQNFADLITVHGPMLASNIADNFDSFTMENLFKIIEGRGDYLCNPVNEEIKTLIPGTCSGRLTGGNLDLLSKTIGTPYSLNAKNKILFIEEVNEPTYKIDKMLFQLKHSGIFNDCNGVVLGDFKNCDKDKPDDFEILEMLKLFFKDYAKPVVYNFKAGHCFQTATIPLGVKCKLTAGNKNRTIELLEQAVI